MLEHTRKANVRSAADHTSTLEINEGQARMIIQKRRQHWAQEQKQIKHTKNPQNKNLKDDQHEPYQQTRLNPCACEGKVVPVCYKTPTMLLMMKSVNSRTLWKEKI